jgi:hypothetical protein
LPLVTPPRCRCDGGVNLHDIQRPRGPVRRGRKAKTPSEHPNRLKEPLMNARQTLIHVAAVLTLAAAAMPAAHANTTAEGVKCPTGTTRPAEQRRPQAGL